MKLRRKLGAGSGGRGPHERIALAGPRDEIKELADAFDAMLERLNRSSTDSAGSWRTPRTSCVPHWRSTGH
jgi:hypothetical protein